MRAGRLHAPPDRARFMDQSDFVHLHVHTHFSLLEATCDPKALVKAAKEAGQTAVAITDNGNLFGAAAFQKAAEAAEIKPILGLDAYVAPKERGLRAKSFREGHRRSFYRIVLLAENEAGWNNLVLLASKGYLEGFYYKPRVDRELLAEHAEGLIALSGSLGGEVAQSLMLDRVEEAEETVRFYQEVFGKDSYFLELVDHGLEDQAKVRAGLIALAEKTGAPLVATNDVHYVKPGDWESQDLALCIGNSKMESDPARFRMSSKELWLKDSEAMIERFADVPEAITNTKLIADRCSAKLEFGGRHLPAFEPPDNKTSEEYFRELCEAGVTRKYGGIDEKVRERLEYEMGIITTMGFIDYFLITWDFIRHARDEGIPVGPGRGSAAGSIVAYALDITMLDPLEYDLLFERFLNSERVSMPDIDIDFCKDRRGEVIQYVEDKYGRDHVAQIITFGTMKARAVIRDVGRALEVPLSDVDRIAKKIPNGPKDTLHSAVESDEEVQEIRKESELTERLFDIGLQLEGSPRHASIHAAGVVITDRPLTERVPLYKNGDDVTTQWPMDILEEAGLLKMDFLGLRTLTIIHEACRNVREARDTEIDIENIPLDDKSTYDMLTAGESSGVFQLESEGMRELLKRLKPDSFKDVVAVLALYRPGPLGSGMVDTYVKRKHGEEETTYLHPILEPILAESLGVILYQEQVMRIANLLAGFSLNEADNLRKAMGKKKPEILAKFKKSFTEGAAKKDVEVSVASEVFDLIEYFAGYGFNKSHSAAYALVTYQTAWLKANWTVPYMAGLMTCEMISIEKTVEYIEECKRLGIEVLPPDVNHSRERFIVDGDAIRFALTALRGVGGPAVEAICAARDADGPFLSLFELCERVDTQRANRTALEALILAGAMDSLGLNRAQKCAVLEDALKAGSAAQKAARSGQGSLFGGDAIVAELIEAEEASVPELVEYPESERLAKEKAVLGFYLTGHPLEEHRALLESRSSASLRKLDKIPDGGEVTIGGILLEVGTRIIKNGPRAGQKMAILGFEDLTGHIEAVVFSDLYKEIRDELIVDRICFLRATVDRRRDTPSLKVAEFIPLEVAKHRLARTLHLELRKGDDPDMLVPAIHRILKSHRGSLPVLFRLHTEELGVVTVQAGDGFQVAPKPALVQELVQILGKEQVQLG